MSERRLHEHGGSEMSNWRAPREYFGDGLIGYFRENSTYERIDGRVTRAEAHRVAGEAHLAEVTTLRQSLGAVDPLSIEGSNLVERIRRASWAGHDEFEKAAALWRKLRRDFQGIRSRHPEFSTFESTTF